MNLIPDLSHVGDTVKAFRESMKRTNQIMVRMLAAVGISTRKHLRATYDPPPDGLHPKTVAWAHAAHPYLSKVGTVNELTEVVAQKQGQSAATAYKWLCDRNPMYEPGGSIPKRFDSLFTAVQRTYAHTSPHKLHANTVK